MQNTHSERPVGFSDAEMAIGRLVLDAPFRTAFFDCGGDIAALRAFSTGHGLTLSEAELTEAATLNELSFTDGITSILGQNAPTGTV